MKRSLVIIVAMLMVALLGANAFAAKAASSGGGAKTEVDGMLSIATDPGAASYGSFGTTLGLGVGVGFDLSDSLKPSSGKIFGRADINYFSWDESVWGISASYTRVPIFVGGRYYIPASGSNVAVFVEAGLEFSFDKQEIPLPFFFGITSSTSDLNIGITPGAGIEVPISKDGLFIGGDARWHIITNDYFTLSLVLGKKF
jgi:hypothetical protein